MEFHLDETIRRADRPPTVIRDVVGRSSAVVFCNYNSLQEVGVAIAIFFALTRNIITPEKYTFFFIFCKIDNIYHRIINFYFCTIVLCHNVNILVDFTTWYS